MTLDDRIPKELAARLVGNPYRRPNIYVDHAGHRVLLATVCKSCGVRLTDTVPHPSLPSRRSELADVSLRTVVLETFTTRLRTAAFDTVELEVEEPVPCHVPEGNEVREPREPRRGLHRSTICTACKPAFVKVAGPANGQMYFDADLERMAVEDDVHGQPIAHTLDVVGRLAARNVIRIVG